MMFAPPSIVAFSAMATVKSYRTLGERDCPHAGPALYFAMPSFFQLKLSAGWRQTQSWALRR